MEDNDALVSARGTFLLTSGLPSSPNTANSQSSLHLKQFDDLPGKGFALGGHEGLSLGLLGVAPVCGENFVDIEVAGDVVSVRINYGQSSLLADEQAGENVIKRKALGEFHGGVGIARGDLDDHVRSPGKVDPAVLLLERVQEFFLAGHGCVPVNLCCQKIHARPSKLFFRTFPAVQPEPGMRREVDGLGQPAAEAQ